MKFRIYFDIDVGFRVKRKNGKWWSFFLLRLSFRERGLAIITWAYEGEQCNGLFAFFAPDDHIEGTLLLLGRRWNWRVK